MAGTSPPEKTAIIGRLPGYNSNIDPTGEFSSQLLKGLTFIDLIPTTYAANVGGYEEAIKSTVSKEKSVTDSFIKAIQGGETPWIHKSGDTYPVTFFQNILKGMQTGLNLDPEFANVEAIRIVGANDSTFTENLSNMFDGANSFTEGIQNAKQNVDSSFRGSISKTVSGIRSLNYQKAMEMFSGKQDSSQIMDTLKGAALGVNFAKPGTWNSSQYSSTLTMFIKLVAPSGHEECIKKNIVQPLMYLLAAGSPVTTKGFAYGLPMIWDVHAHGITRFKIGSIAAMTISRGSFETTFNDKFQPTVVDVRMTIIPLVQDFAVQHTDDGAGDMYNKHLNNLGVQHPGDIYSGTMNSIGKVSGHPKPLTEVKIIEL